MFLNLGIVFNVQYIVADKHCMPPYYELRICLLVNVTIIVII